MTTNSTTTQLSLQFIKQSELRGIPGHLYALLGQRVLVEVQDGCCDGARRREDRQPDVDGVASFGVENDDLLSFTISCCFLKAARNATQISTFLKTQHSPALGSVHFIYFTLSGGRKPANLHLQSLSR